MLVCTRAHGPTARGSRASAPAIIAVCLPLWACSREDCPKVGLLEDARFPLLCISDSLGLSPETGTLAPIVVPREAAAEGSTDITAEEADDGQNLGKLDMAVSGTDEHGHPREAAHVDVMLDQLLGARLDAGATSHCERRTDAHLHCQLDVNGQARFELQHTGDGETGRVTVTAKSGDLETVSVIQVDQLVLQLTIADAQLSAFESLSTPPSLGCYPTVPAFLDTCAWEDIRHVRVDAQLLLSTRDNDVEARARGTVTGIVRVTGGGYAFLSDTDTCDISKGTATETTLQFPADDSAAPVYLCVGRRGGTFEVEGVLEDLRLSGAATVTAAAAPAAVLVASVGDAGPGTPVLLGCDERQLALAAEVTPSGITVSDETDSYEVCDISELGGTP